MDETPGTPQPLDASQRRRVERHHPVVAKIARTVHRMLPHMELDELEALGAEGLVEAARRYHPESGVPFGAFAHYRIRGKMIDFARKQARAGRQHARALKQLEASQSVLEQASADGSARDLSALKDRVAQVRKIVERNAAAVLMSHAATVEPDAVAAETRDDPEARIVGADLRAKLRSSLERLDEADRRLVQALYMEGRPMQAVAAELGINKSTVSRRHARILGELAVHFRGPPAD